MLNGTNNRVLGSAYTLITIPNVKRSNRKWTFSNNKENAFMITIESYYKPHYSTIGIYQ
jgi:hypothetical protein